MELNRKDFLSLPKREWGKVTQYTSVLIVPTGKKHDSGWHLMAIIGCKDQRPIEIAAYCDDVNWLVQSNRMRTDMTYKSRVCHMWGNRLIFEVGLSLSSVDVIVKERENDRT